MIKGLNFGYQKIDVCEKDCMLYYEDDLNKNVCDFFKESDTSILSSEVERVYVHLKRY